MFCYLGEQHSEEVAALRRHTIKKVLCVRNSENAVHLKVLWREFLLVTLYVSLSQQHSATLEVKLRHALMISGLLLGQILQEVLVKMSGSKGNG